MRPSTTVVGRPTKLTPDLAYKVYGFLRNGASFVAVCRALSINTSSFTEWRKPCALEESDDHEHGPRCQHIVEVMARGDNGPAGTGEFLPFSAIVERAMGEHEALMVTSITGAVIQGDAKSAFEMLKRRYPESWNQPDKVELSGPDGGAIVVDDPRVQLMERVDAARKRLQDLDIIAKSS